MIHYIESSLYMINTLHVSGKIFFIFSYHNTVYNIWEEKTALQFQFFPISCSPTVHLIVNCDRQLSSLTNLSVGSTLLACWSSCSGSLKPVKVQQLLSHLIGLQKGTPASGGLLDVSVVAFSPLMCSIGRLHDFKTFSTALKTSFVCRVKLTDLNPEKQEESFRFLNMEFTNIRG